MQYKKTSSAVRKLLPKRSYVLGTIAMAGFLFGIAALQNHAEMKCNGLGGHMTRIGCVKTDALIRMYGELPY